MVANKDVQCIRSFVMSASNRGLIAVNQPFISFFKDKKKFWIEEGCYVTENSNTPLDPDVSIAQAEVEPGSSTVWHRVKNTTERYVILSGSGIVDVGDEPATPVDPGDVVCIPPGVRQRIHNRGGEPLVFLAVCTPRFRPENYENAE